ncbi:nucleoside recognition domain-containing protein, partial [Reinekea sp.]
MTALSPIDHLRALARDTLEVSWTLYKIMVPTLIVIKVLEELGGVELLSQLLAPLMASLGLPETMALVWATSLLTNIYAG